MKNLAILSMWLLLATTASAQVENESGYSFGNGSFRHGQTSDGRTWTQYGDDFKVYNDSSGKTCFTYGSAYRTTNCTGGDE
jgi:hypothetical protein